MRRDLHLTFLTSDQKKHKEIYKDYQGDLSKEAITAFMEKMIQYDIPRKEDGVYQCAQIIAAKIVKTEETVFFDYSDQLPQVEKVTTPADELTKLATPKPAKPAKTEMTMAEMARFSPTKVKKIIEADLAESNHDEASVERVLKQALRSQVLNEILPKGKHFFPQAFYPYFKEIYAAKQWNTLLVRYLKEVSLFFSPEDWLDVVERYQGVGREITAELLAEDGEPNFKQAKLEMHKLLNQARRRLREYRQKFMENQAKLAVLLR